MKFYSIIFSIILIVAGVQVGFKPKYSTADPTVTVSTFGKQPTVVVDKDNHVKVVFGQEEEIFYTVSTDEGKSFSTPERIGKQSKLALGMTRGPQITTTKDFTVIAAVDHTGKIMAYQLKNKETRWSKPVNILDSDTTAKEGFVALAAGKENTVHAVWLDLRLGNKNNIFSASSIDGGKTWSRNKLAYKSPSGSVCPCCRPSITADQQGNVYIMFRNELAGARDMYMVHSKDGGKSFSDAKKLGVGTWVLKACPMDGGALAIDANGKVGTIWRRENTIFYAVPGTAEQRIGEGKASSLVKTTKGNYMAWQQGNNIMALTPNQLSAEVIGTGSYPRLTALANEKILNVWEADGKILAKMLHE